ncbi:[citrate (pro-3S)-lyase] ligase [Dethiosulfatibacter aminovorans DSM 17477]|uniref:[Citrate [pro-3S]-lyase] ligase n=1 Tax=Dethiosulfatibacter aminovorans DSM 17477 TaxID=1121476 RepID=A0A1M6HTA9_9FIRM|nr:[citrate (pro-3S)-lyase] ligase [Dethiosulfatibacter aminovorans]SHJ25377.1 [citrate (pro-3S)-lyase] ligase [Dethiosulfatibacter aminovorans DSM 17477]
MFNEYTMEYLNKNDKTGRKRVAAFLDELDIVFDEHIDITINMLDEDGIIATASAEKNLVKCLAVKPEYRSENLLNTVFSELLNHLHHKGILELSLFTSHRNEKIIESLGFSTVCKTDNIVFMENSNDRFSNYLKKISSFKEDCINTASIVMNMNPITNGHLYLIEKVSEENDCVYIFIVSEDKSAVPFETRYRLAVESTRHLENVKIITGGEYIISSSTFPSYFLKDYTVWLDSYCEMDLTIFGKYIAKELNITKRYVGNEPYCKVTNRYNEKMKEILPKYGIEVIEIERFSIGSKAVSASHVRKLAGEGKFEELKKLVPEATYDYLISEYSDSKKRD